MLTIVKLSVEVKDILTIVRQSDDVFPLEFFLSFNLLSIHSPHPNKEKFNEGQEVRTRHEKIIDLY